MKKKFLDIFYSMLDKEKFSDTQSITLPMSLISNYIHINTKHVYEEFDLIQSEIDILITLYNYNGLTATQTAERVLFTSGGISKVVKKLLSKELVYKEESKEDKRSQYLFITQKGKDIVERCLPQFQEIEESFFKALDDDEKAVMKKAFKKILYSFSNK